MRGTVDGLILREVAVGESDKLLTVLYCGKLTCSADLYSIISDLYDHLAVLIGYGHVRRAMHLHNG